jgi:hypothetical protein
MDAVAISALLLLGLLTFGLIKGCERLGRGSS